VPRRHLKKDDRTTMCGLTLAPKFTKQLAADRQSVTCGACELESRPRTARPASSPAVDEFATAEGDDEGGDAFEGGTVE
jgi:hypothetical protein